MHDGALTNASSSALNGGMNRLNQFRNNRRTAALVVSPATNAATVAAESTPLPETTLVATAETTAATTTTTAEHSENVSFQVSEGVLGDNTQLGDTARKIFQSVKFVASDGEQIKFGGPISTRFFEMLNVPDGLKRAYWKNNSGKFVKKSNERRSTASGEVKKKVLRE